MPPREPLTRALVGFAIVGLVDTVALGFLGARVPLVVRIGAHLYTVALTLSLGVVFGACEIAGRALLDRLGSRKPSRWIFVAHVVATAVLAELVLSRTFSRQADSAFDGRFALPLRIAMSAGIALGLPLLLALATWVARYRWLRLVLLVAGLAAAIVNVFLYRDDYPESHALAGWAAAMVLGASLGPWLEPSRLGTRRALVVSLVATSLLVVLSPPNAVRLQIFRSPGAIGAWAHASTVWWVPHPRDVDIPDQGVGFAVVADRPTIPPTTLSERVSAPIVVLVTIDATRADVVLDPANDQRFSSFATLKRRGTSFAMARSAGSQTAVSLTALFSGRFFSELYWTKAGRGASRFDYAAEDPSPRFPALLDEAGVATYKAGGLKFVANEFGAAPGFAEEIMVVDNRRHAQADEVVGPLLAKLRAAGPGPLLLYTHLMEPHAPYDRATKTGEPFERYLAEVELADRQIGRILRVMQTSRLASRAYLVVTSDHGEAFGEHGTKEHTKTIYDELLRVPLLVFGPNVQAQDVTTPVSLVDLGPTILDVFDVPTPGTFRGQSLLPILVRGVDAAPPLTRPILAEGRLRRALFDGDMKVIVDERRKTVEAFDLAKDPGELENLAFSGDERADVALAKLKTFYANNVCKRPGYRPIYKP